jgi:hypothetical protein
MLARSTYPQEYIDDCRKQIETRVAAYTTLAAAVGRSGKDALAEFEPVFFNDLVFVLDGFFTHRTRAVEGKNGNPLNEVRVLCMSMLENGGRLGVDKTIKLKPETSVLGLSEGDEIRLSAGQFEALANAYFAELESRFAGKG